MKTELNPYDPEEMQKNSERIRVLQDFNPAKSTLIKTGKAELKKEFEEKLKEKSLSRMRTWAVIKDEVKSNAQNLKARYFIDLSDALAICKQAVEQAEKRGKVNIAEPFTGEFVNMLLVNAMRQINEEQREALTIALLERTPQVKDRIREEALEEVVKTCEIRKKQYTNLQSITIANDLIDFIRNLKGGNNG
jgi:hypothetical protein